MSFKSTLDKLHFDYTRYLCHVLLNLILTKQESLHLFEQQCMYARLPKLLLLLHDLSSDSILGAKYMIVSSELNFATYVNMSDQRALTP